MTPGNLVTGKNRGGSPVPCSKFCAICHLPVHCWWKAALRTRPNHSQIVIRSYA
ncbi:hypothetical protein PISMIDRAFT_440629 [Pisolithus microcarpus 441]|uniref:Uncharacterized protein n=1 Tax=Pisolithus microcarpus 441 TaxID=765257 RepID=A0A0C9ZUR2_9AGAM|nr:hypothetical protein PISMIDRAFT_440629 [Pisolithus microcarpus 441]